jgi:hypothetical protein
MKRKTAKKLPTKAPAAKGTIRYVTEREIMRGKGTDAVIAAVKRRFPESKTSAACVAYYRHWMRERGVRVPPAGKGVGA